MMKRKLPTREEIICQMWTLARTDAAEAMRLACFPEEWEKDKPPRLVGVTEFKRGSNGVFEVKFVDRGKLLERLMDALDRSGEDQVDQFLAAMEGED